MNVASKDLTPTTRRNLAETYAQYLALERPATKAGLETTPQFTEIMRWWRLRTLADLYRGNLQEQLKNPTREEVHAYYTEHLPSYQHIEVDRILIPRTRITTEETKKADEKALQAANAARERLAKGEDLKVVQKETNDSLGIVDAPFPGLGTLTKSQFPPEQGNELFALHVGEVSKVEVETASYVVYKIKSQETLAEEAVKDEISREIARRKFSAALRAITESAQPELNQAYFGPPAAAPSVAYPASLASPHP
jgi:parvulin-like peptidyl-prolyl isomerase